MSDYDFYADEHYDSDIEEEEPQPIRCHYGFVDRSVIAEDTFNDLLETYLPLGVDWEVTDEAWTFHLTDLTITFANDWDTSIGVEAESEIMGRTRVDSVRSELRSIVHASLMDPSWSTVGLAVMLLQLVEEATSHVQDFQAWQQSRMRTRAGKDIPSRWMAQTGFNANSVDAYHKVLGNPVGVDLMTVNDTVSDDEEDYGEFQAVRGQHEHETIERRADEKVSWFDEYQTARVTNMEVRVERHA
ncbi:hypothetical protein CLAFUW4_10548 [Fulvia fulva]|uniref:Uncharacterized protein n=1 Tax=Passalora fulva TaxID=5499 RepID=A0A9Q8P7I5_PASFU|nr:uncharacterized protein CLAFUR5_05162 [Fulvia fulva]KAK4615805.1 hypothetical protein CLAFUR4_10553 [Fulvia fulva]KAK4616997.1 hypothetical protein CLAFUR0_10691 [Fulvia fulva]UJO16078.1 hypothetical protein CLAFUR5_05162 [Fulvia fulva]WPV19282.1 hypothetical protein CLAFUW4_10548 [Fulvia fulva]WPV34555.1 hypothetical protein CLAFUW7_10550 [Fulvia fulva]